MPKIMEEITINAPLIEVFSKISTVDFMRLIDPASFGQDTEILYQNDRLLRFLQKGTPSGDVEIERMLIHENHTILTQRKPPLSPFIYQFSIRIFYEQNSCTLLKHINEFELDESNKPKEGLLLTIIKKNDLQNLQNIKKYFENIS